MTWIESITFKAAGILFSHQNGIYPQKYYMHFGFVAIQLCTFGLTSFKLNEDNINQRYLATISNMCIIFFGCKIFDFTCLKFILLGNGTMKMQLKH